MNRTIEDSKNYDIVCISFGKKRERGIKVTSSGKKDSFLEQTMEIKAEKCTARDMGFSNEQIAVLRENIEGRKTKTKIAIDRYKQIMGR